jgi:outer membrane protein assembly factor BamA
MTVARRRVGIAATLAIVSALAVGCHRKGVEPDVRTVFVGAPRPHESLSAAAERCPPRTNDKVAIEDVQGQVVVGRCISGLRSLSPSTIRKELSVRVGEPFDPDLTTRDVKRLHTIGLLDDIEVLASPTEGGVAVHYLVRERAWIKEIHVAGMKLLTLEELKATTAVGDLLDEWRLREAAEALTALLGQRGVPNARVVHEVERIRDNGTIVTFRVDR